VSAVWLRASGADVVLTLHIQPGAKTTEVAGPYGTALKIRLAAPPVDGKANECLIAFLAARLGAPRSQVTLEAGASSRSKRVRVAAVSVEEALAVLV
jgi:uncharacterized protein